MIKDSVYTWIGIEKEINRVNTDFINYMIPKKTKDKQKEKVDWLNKRDQDRLERTNPNCYYEYWKM